jgi:hypothetical protein
MMMLMSVGERVRRAFADQAEWCTKLGSPFTALICATLADRLDDSTAVGRRVLRWQGDPLAQADALPLRICGALHALARRSEVPELTSVYPMEPMPSPERLWHAIRIALTYQEAHFEAYLNTAPQTNEVGRSAVLMCGLLTIAAELNLPLYLFEIGASAGLNLIPDRYRYRFGSVTWGRPEAPLLLEPVWQGIAPPVEADLRIVGRYGSDLAPIDVSVSDERSRLISYVWPDQPDRLQRLEAALTTVRLDPPCVEKMEAADWVAQRIPGTEPERGAVRVLFHSLVWGYLSAESQRRIAVHMDSCAMRATRDSPLAWLRFEIEDSGAASLRLRIWPDGEDRLLATSQPHGRAITSLL